MHCPMTAKQPIVPPRVDEPVFNIEHICKMLSVCEIVYVCGSHGPLIRYVKLLVAHAPGMPGTFSPPPTSKETAS